MRILIWSWLALVGLLALAGECDPEVVAQPPIFIPHHRPPLEPPRRPAEVDVVIGAIEVGPVEPADAFLRLAQLCVNESGWSSPADCAAIHAVLRATQRDDETLVDAMLRHAPRLFGLRPARTPEVAERYRWVRSLRADAGEPEAWPADHGPWSRFRERWKEVLRFSRRAVDGSVRSSCSRPPIAWGGAMDDDIALARGLVRVDCGETRNRFWARPTIGGDS